ncbi:MAG: transporter [Clostridiales bacterium]|nr:transporter [Clostridiales bacterium]
MLLLLHLLLGVYSLSGVFSKKAAGEAFLSLRFCLFYGGIIFLLGIYAIFWQQIIKRMPLTTAYANKAVTVVWGLLWGIVIFHEGITIKKTIGALIVMAGIVIYSIESAKEEEKKAAASIDEKASEKEATEDE